LDLTKETIMKGLLGCGVIAIIIGATVLAQEPQSPGSLSALTNEVRLLRLAIERSTQTQTQIQGLSVYLSAQQSRLVQTSARVDSIRKDLDVAARDSKAAADNIAGLRAELDNRSDPKARAQIEDGLVGMTRQGAQAAAYEAQLRTREAEAYRDLQTELARWTELITRLEQAIAQ
jgi:hypothetical protein